MKEQQFYHGPEVDRWKVWVREHGAIWGWVWWCNLRLDMMVRSGVVVCAILPALLSFLGSFFFFLEMV